MGHCNHGAVLKATTIGNSPTLGRLKVDACCASITKDKKQKSMRRFAELQMLPRLGRREPMQTGTGDKRENRPWGGAGRSAFQCLHPIVHIRESGI